MNPTKSRLLIMPHQGLGDLILCVGLFIEKAAEHDDVVIIVRNLYATSLARSLSHVRNIRIKSLPPLPNGLNFRRLELIIGFLAGALARLFGFKFLALGYLGHNFFGPKRSLRFDESFYDQAHVPFAKRWDSFNVSYDMGRQDQLYKQLVGDYDSYIFLHEDASRGFTIDRSKIVNGKPIVEPLPAEAGYEVWDYLKVIENAGEIHVIESSFAAFIESLQLPNKKFAHRYARPEASLDPNHEFTYKSRWVVLTG